LKGKMKQINYFYFLFLLALMLVSCSRQEPIPKQIIVKDTFANILADMHVFEAANALGHLDSSLTGYNAISYQLGIYKKYHITKGQFDSSYAFYSERPDLFTEVYEKVMSNLSQRQALLSKKSSK